jgi:HK97 family phage prohead protease
MTVVKGAISSNLPIHEDDSTAWDSGAAVKRVRDYASDSDGNIDFTKYRKAFFWVDSESGDKQGDYKLPYADVFDGELQAVWRGCAAAMGVMMGGRGGVDIPDDDKKAVVNEIAKYYKKFDKELPDMPDSMKNATGKKGAIADELAEEQVWEQKCALMEDVYEVFWAFCDVLYDEDTPASEFNTLLAEMIGLFRDILNGTYTDPDDDEATDSTMTMPMQEAIRAGVPAEKIEQFKKLFEKKIEQRKKTFTEADKRFTSAEIKELGADGSFTAIASTGIVDRHGEVVSPEGWDLKAFTKNPVLLWAHDHTIPAIGRATKVWLDGVGNSAKLMFKGQWQTVTDEGKAAAQLVEQGILNSFSVGFLPSEMDGNTYTKQELLEISLVNVPANPDAQMLAYDALKEAGFEKTVIKNLGISVEVLDKLKSIEKDVDNLNKKLNTLVKAQDNIETSAAPRVRSEKQVRAERSLAKVIAKGADKILEGDKKNVPRKESIEMTKVIKRAAEILLQSQR